VFGPAGSFNVFVYTHQRDSRQRLGYIDVQDRNNNPAWIERNASRDLHGNYQGCFGQHAALDHGNAGGEIIATAKT